MGQLLRSLAVIAALAVGTTPLAAFQAPVQSAGGSEEAPAKAPPKAPVKVPAKGNGVANKGQAAEQKKQAKKDDKAAASTQRVLDSGVAAYEAGKTDQAVRAFNTAISGGALNTQQMARALYYRGLAYRKKDRPARAIADLSAAAWIKDGLSASEQQEAIANRAAAYRDVGVTNAPAAALPAGVPGGSFGADAWQPASAPKAAAPAPVASAPVSAPQTATYVPARPPPPPSTPQSASSSSSSSGGIGGFFHSITSMFGGGSSHSEVTTASIHEGPAPATSAWSQTTEISTPSSPQPAPQAAAPAPPPPPPPQAAPVRRPAPQAAARAGGNNAASFPTKTKVVAVAPPVVAPPKETGPASGKYHVQVAAVRSRDEAYALSVRLVSQYGSELGSRRPEVKQKVMGSMGTFYRVSVGPYASAEEPQKLCSSLRASGFDCLIITQ